VFSKVCDCPGCIEIVNSYVAEKVQSGALQNDNEIVTALPKGASARNLELENRSTALNSGVGKYPVARFQIEFRFGWRANRRARVLVGTSAAAKWAMTVVEVDVTQPAALQYHEKKSCVRSCASAIA